MFSGQLEAYQKPRDNCDAYGSAATGQSGRLYVRSQSAINVVKAGVSSRMKMTIKSFDGSKTLDTYLSPNVHAAGKPNRVGEAQYFMRNVAAHTFDLGTKSMPVKVCIEIINSTSQPRSIRDNNFDIDPNEYLYVQKLADNWKKNEVAAGNVFAEDGAATWKEQYQVWARPLMTKYADMMCWEFNENNNFKYFVFGFVSSTAFSNSF